MWDAERETIAFAERMLALLDRASTTSTYKYAVLLSLMDLVLEKTDNQGVPPESVTTRQLAEKTITLYWPQTNQYLESGKILRQNRTGQATILQDILTFRSQKGIGVAAPHHAARLADPDGYERLLRMVEWNLILNPLHRLQTVGEVKTEFIYNISWDKQIEYQKNSVNQYQKGAASDFDNRVLLKPGVGEHLLRLHALLRPLIQREWTRLVARINDQPESKLEHFLFHSRRAWVAKLHGPLRELQGGYCFYCHEQLHGRPEVDHFIPWSRQTNDGLANLVVAHDKCNRAKSDYLASSSHVYQWLRRLDVTGHRDDLDVIASEYQWELGLEASLGVASSIYLRLRPEMILWRNGKDFERVEESTLSMLESLFKRVEVA